MSAWLDQVGVALLVVGTVIATSAVVGPLGYALGWMHRGRP